MTSELAEISMEISEEVPENKILLQYYFYANDEKLGMIPYRSVELAMLDVPRNQSSQYEKLVKKRWHIHIVAI